MKAKIYHNPRCSKSRAALALLTQRGVDVDVVEYLEKPPSRTELQRLLRKLRLPALAIVRTEEPEFRAHASRALSNEEIFELIARHPRLLQRPIVEVDAGARIGRPPEAVLDLIE